MWFILPLWSGKESHCSKWESSFSTLRVITRVGGGHFLLGRGGLGNHSNIKNKHAEQRTENVAEEKRHPALDGGTNKSPQSDEHRSDRTCRHHFFYHAGAVFASRLIRLRRNRASVYSWQASLWFENNLLLLNPVLSLMSSHITGDWVLDRTIWWATLRYCTSQLTGLSTATWGSNSRPSGYWTATLATELCHPLASRSSCLCHSI